MALLNPLDVMRRIAAMAGFLALIALALLLLWRVYVHHLEAVPYEQDEPVTVRMDVRSTTFVVRSTTFVVRSTTFVVRSTTFVNFANELS